MNFIDLKQPKNELTPGTGKLLIAEPFLSDPNFSRSVILLADHNKEGDIGFILNQVTDFILNELVPDFEATDITIRQGGPVQIDTMQMLHRLPLVLGGTEVCKGIYWGGSYDALREILASGNYNPNDVQLFLGYAGWVPGQLEKELEEGSWMISDNASEWLFDTNPKQVWQKAIKLLGKDYEYMANMPLDPSLN